MELNHHLQDFLFNVEDISDSQGTIDRRKSDIRQYQKWLDTGGEEGEFDDMDEQDHYLMVHGFLRESKTKEYSGHTISARYETLRQFYEYMTNHHRFFDETPFKRLSRQKYIPKPDREIVENSRPYITQEQKETLCDNVGPPAFRNELMIRLMFQTGLRQNEVVNLKVENVNLEENRVEDVWRSKVGDLHTVSFGESLSWWLDEWLNGGHRDGFVTAIDSKFVFLTDRTPQFHEGQPNLVIRKAAENAGIQETRQLDKQGNECRAITSHAMRRGHGMHLWKNDVDLHTIRQRLGHKSIEQTQDYLPIDDSDVADKVSAIKW